MSVMDGRDRSAMPPDVALKLRRMMFAAPLSTAAYILGLAATAAALAMKVGDHAMAYIAAVALSLNLIRVILVSKTVPSDARATVDLLSLLVIGCVFSSLMAALVIRAFEVGNIEAVAMAVILAAGYLSGVLIRASVVPKLAIPHILTLFVPLIIASVFTSDGRYWPTAFLLTCFCIGCVDLSRIIYSHMAAQLLAEHRLSLAAMTDSLTGLSNRTALDGALTNRSTSGGAAIMAMIDLDGFKSVNDSHGHAVGDELLKAVARRIRKSVDGTHLASRLGGDEFAILFEFETSAADASRICDDIVRLVGSQFEIDGVECRIGASVGLASSHDPWTLPTIKERADKALYVAKREGRARVVWSTTSPSLVPETATDARDAPPNNKVGHRPRIKLRSAAWK